MIIFPASTRIEYFLNKIAAPFIKFKFQGKSYCYFTNIYNFTWRNERAVEIPIVWNVVKKRKNLSILEVGNVLSHYFPVYHDVVDKYEKAPGVINMDIEKYKPRKKYDLVVSISTFEHLGHDKDGKDPKKILRVIEQLKKHLKPDGEILFTVPIGYNRSLDELITKGKIKANRLGFLKRISKYNIWKEVKIAEVLKLKYSIPFPNANAVGIFVIRGERNYLPK